MSPAGWTAVVEASLKAPRAARGRRLKKDWISREPVRARLRATIKRPLARYNYPPDHEVRAIELVLRQMEHFADVWSKDGTREEEVGNSATGIRQTVVWKRLCKVAAGRRGRGDRFGAIASGDNPTQFGTATRDDELLV